MLAICLVAGSGTAQQPGTRPPQEWSAENHLTGAWGGLRPWMAERGIRFAGGWTADWSDVWRGGVRQRDTFRHLTVAGVEFDLNELAGLPTTTAFVEGYVLQGRNATSDFGDFQVLSNIDGDNREQVSEAWLESRFGTDWLRFKFGKMDANGEFAYLDEGTTFIHSTPGFPPTIVGFVSYPDPGVGAVLEVSGPLGGGLAGYARAGVYDGALGEGRPTGKLGFGNFFTDDEADSYQSLLELGISHPRLGPLGQGRLALGAWHHSARFDRFGGGSQRGTEGIYALWDQRLWREPGGEPDAPWQGLALAASVGLADETVSAAASSWFLGLTWRGAIPGRDQDVVALGMAHVDLSDAPNTPFPRNETAWELQYRLQATPWLTVAPVVQYVDRPSGSLQIDPAWVGTLRLEVVF